ncbi:MAG: hypothetical protein ABH837_01515 [bacterium]
MYRIGSALYRMVLGIIKYRPFLRSFLIDKKIILSIIVSTPARSAAQEVSKTPTSTKHEEGIVSWEKMKLLQVFGIYPPSSGGFFYPPFAEDLGLCPRMNASSATGDVTILLLYIWGG